MVFQKCSPDFDNFSKEKTFSLLKFAVCQLQNEKPLWKRRRGQFNEEQKGGIRRKSNKTRKSLDVVSLFFCIIMEHHAGVLSKAQETTPHKDGVYTRAKPLGPVL